MIQDFSSKWNLQLELVCGLFQLFGTIAPAIRKGFSRLDLSHRGNSVADFLLPTPSAGWVVKSVYNSCKIHSWNLSLALPPPTQPGQAKVFISCSIYSPRKGNSSITLLHLLNALHAIAGISSVAASQNKSCTRVPWVYSFVESNGWVSVGFTCTRGKQEGTVRVSVGAHLFWA